jgi:hypothetical protein
VSSRVVGIDVGTSGLKGRFCSIGFGIDWATQHVERARSPNADFERSRQVHERLNPRLAANY